MPSNQPYIFWSRQDLFDKMKGQCYAYDFDLRLLHEAVYSEEWNPIEQYNGCNFVQDGLHPFYPCFIHDYRWIVEGITNRSDKEFRNNLLKFGYSTFRATMYYFAVRIGGVFFKLKKRYNK